MSYPVSLRWRERERTVMCYVQFGCRAQTDMTSLALIAGNAEWAISQHETSMEARNK